MPAELAKAFLLGKQLGRAHQCVARCYDRYAPWDGVVTDGARARARACAWGGKEGVVC